MKLIKSCKIAASLAAIAVLFLAVTLLFRSTPATVTLTTPARAATPATALSSNSPERAIGKIVSTNAIFLTPDVLWQRPIREETFARFHDWAEKFQAAAPGERPSLEATGIELAKLRRQELLSLIKSDPERALE